MGLRSFKIVFLYKAREYKKYNTNSKTFMHPSKSHCNEFEVG